MELVLLNGKPMKFESIKIERPIQRVESDRGWAVYETTGVVIVWLYTRVGFYGTYRCKDNEEGLSFCQRRTGRYLTVVNGEKRDNHDAGFVNLIKSWHP